MPVETQSTHWMWPAAMRWLRPDAPGPTVPSRSRSAASLRAGWARAAIGLILLAIVVGWLIAQGPVRVAQPTPQPPTLVVPHAPSPGQRATAVSARWMWPHSQVHDSAHGRIRTAQRYAPALRALQDGPAASAALYKSLHDEVRIACTLVHQPDGASARVDLDATRRPWLDVLQQRCAGLPSAYLQPLAADHPAQRAWRALLPANQVNEADAQTRASALLNGSADSALLHEALRFQLGRERLPLARIYAGQTPPVRVDLEAAVAPAADLVACARAASCGSEALWTLHYCAQLGCPAGSDLDQALRWLLPKAQYENARRLAAWVLEGAESEGPGQ